MRQLHNYWQSRSYRQHQPDSVHLFQRLLRLSGQRRHLQHRDIGHDCQPLRFLSSTEWKGMRHHARSRRRHQQLLRGPGLQHYEPDVCCASRNSNCSSNANNFPQPDGLQEHFGYLRAELPDRVAVSVVCEWNSKNRLE